MLNKVPEVTLYFWIIKVLCTTVGETAADYLATNVGLGLTRTTYITASLLLAVLVVQFRLRRYVPPIYWLGIVLISVVGTQITDNLTDLRRPAHDDHDRLPIILACVFAAWYASERTLSIHTIVTTRREAFYWLAVLFTFALGTAAGDLTAERLALGYFLSAVLFAVLIGIVALAHLRFGLGAITAFWIAYILTRPLGASLGDFLSQPTSSRWPRARHDRDEPDLPRCHPRRRRLSDGDAQGCDRGRGGPCAPRRDRHARHAAARREHDLSAARRVRVCSGIGQEPGPTMAPCLQGRPALHIERGSACPPLAGPSLPSASSASS